MKALRLRVVTFSDQESFTIPIGAELASDEILLEVNALDEITVSIYVTEQPSGMPLTSSRGKYRSYISPLGDFTATEVMPVSTTQAGPLLLSTVEVRQPAALSIVVLGDEITSGTLAFAGAINQPWPVYLAERLRSNSDMTHVAIVNAGIDANRLVDTIEVLPTLVPGSQTYSYYSGPSALARFDRDVIAQAHVKWVIVFEGLNDIRPARSSGANPATPRTFTDIIGAYKQLIARAHAAGLKIYGCTLTPANFTGDLEIFRQEAVNSWIRNSGQFDAVIDFDATIRDPSNPNRILPAYLNSAQSSPPLIANPLRYPNNRGYQAMANAVDLSLFQ